MAGKGVCSVHKLVSQAKKTFSLSKSEPQYVDQLQQLKAIMRTLKWQDFNLNPSIFEEKWNCLSHRISDAPAASIDVYESNQFTIAIFLLKANKTMPLHDHPGMFGLMKVLFGSMKVTSYNRPVMTADKSPPYLASFCNSVVAKVTSDLCTLNENKGNIHEIEAQDCHVVFLDILAPPYNPDEGRDCTYYTKQPCPLDQMENDVSDRSLWLNPSTSPSWFNCVPQGYRGPKIS